MLMCRSQVEYCYGTVNKSNGRSAGLDACIYVEQCFSERYVVNAPLLRAHFRLYVCLF